MTIPEQIISLQNIVDLAIKLQKDFPEDYALQYTISTYLYKIKQCKSNLKNTPSNHSA